MAMTQRDSGILLHPTCLPGPFGIGELGSEAIRFADWLHRHGQSVWQVLPLGPTGYGDSPYQTLSAFAGNPNLISLADLAQQGWLPWEELKAAPRFDAGRVDFATVIPWRTQMLQYAFLGFQTHADSGTLAEFSDWCNEEREWLADYALFRSLKMRFGGASWLAWPKEFSLRDPAPLSQARTESAAEIQQICFEQWVFHRQWSALRSECQARGIRLIGDIPIFVAHDSSDVWSNREQFALQADGQPAVVAGVPPDYFSATGQRWGNPLYRWDMMKEDGYRWWIQRLKATFALFDEVRIDHFRGFESYWEIPASEPTAVVGRWRQGPAADFFQHIQAELGELPIIAEDLGVITAEVEALRDQFSFPGMKVLQFAWSDPANPFLPHNYSENCIAYVGTHDNNTTLGWWQHEMQEDGRQFAKDYLREAIHEPHWAMIHCGMRSVARTFVATMQDLLALGSEARMNTPGQEQGNWSWRMPEDYDRLPCGELLQQVTWLTRRLPEQQQAAYGDAAQG
ncbi:MAG: 4-alpha-glucanotransferase [Anaerolineaceae bacterium]|nr:4-alpha-glucanotransferase [Anaerolineaceae bacterium]